MRNLRGKGSILHHKAQNMVAFEVYTSRLSHEDVISHTHSPHALLGFHFYSFTPLTRRLYSKSLRCDYYSVHKSQEPAALFLARDATNPQVAEAQTTMTVWYRSSGNIKRRCVWFHDSGLGGGCRGMGYGGREGKGSLDLEGLRVG